MKTKAEHASKKALFQASVFLLDGFYFILFFILKNHLPCLPKKRERSVPLSRFFPLSTWRATMITKQKRKPSARHVDGETGEKISY